MCRCCCYLLGGPSSPQAPSERAGDKVAVLASIDEGGLPAWAAGASATAAATSPALARTIPAVGR